jgi:hypothetical protein
MNQFQLDFEGGLIDRYPEFQDCVRGSVYGCGRQFKAVAADMDMSASQLSQKLADNTDNHFPLERLPDLLDATRNLDPIFWLVEKYCDDPDTKSRRAKAELAAILPRLQKLLIETEAK